MTEDCNVIIMVGAELPQACAGPFRNPGISDG